jgi:NADH:ubiquinone oxidoreductase subunit 4 (subunit M)
MLGILLILPLISIFCILFLARGVREIFFIALIFAILGLIQTLIIMTLFDPSISTFQFQSFGKLGIDGISLWLIWLVHVIVPIVLLSSWKAIHTLIKSYIILILLVGFWCTAVFVV